MKWDEEKVELLRTLLGQKIPLEKIGEALGVSKRAVIGKRYRLELAERPSLAHVSIDEDGPELPEPVVETTLDTTAKTADASPSPIRVLRPPAACCWPIGEPGRRDFRFCGETPVVAKTPYCSEHAGLAYPRLRPSRNERPDAVAA